jgi:Ca2+/Na+ antiporter
MNIQQIEKSIKQMRQIFIFLAIVSGLGIVVGLLNVLQGYYDLMALIILNAVFTYAFWQAGSSLENPDPKAYKRAKTASIILLFLFPVLTIFGISYLNKLSKPEMKQAFGVTE